MIDDKEPYSYIAKSLADTTVQGVAQVVHLGDILIGLCFPKAKKGDKMNVVANNKVICTIKIEDPDEIHLPFCGEFGFPLTSMINTGLYVSNADSSDKIEVIGVYVYLDIAARAGCGTYTQVYKFPDATFVMRNGYFGKCTEELELDKDMIVFESES